MTDLPAATRHYTIRLRGFPAQMGPSIHQRGAIWWPVGLEERA